MDFPFYVDPTSGSVHSLTGGPIDRDYTAGLVLESITGHRPPTDINLTVVSSSGSNSVLSDADGLLPSDPVDISVAEDVPAGSEVYLVGPTETADGIGLSYELFEQVRDKTRLPGNRFYHQKS